MVGKSQRRRKRNRWLSKFELAMFQMMCKESESNAKVKVNGRFGEAESSEGIQKTNTKTQNSNERNLSKVDQKEKKMQKCKETGDCCCVILKKRFLTEKTLRNAVNTFKQSLEAIWINVK